MKNNSRPVVIAIDGPAGSGKSTISKLIAKRLNLFYVDTGAMYRALTLKAMRNGADLKDERALTALAKSTTIDLREDKSILQVMLDGEDVAPLIRTQDVTNNIKHIARVPGVRHEMVKLQREIGRRNGAVLEGRDIGTVVFPDAEYKFYLDASLEERAKRRHEEMAAAGERADLKTLKDDIKLRDESDITRNVGALKRADDAILIDTTNLAIAEVVEKLLSCMS